MKYVSYLHAVKKYGVEARKRIPSKLTKDTKRMYFKMCVEALAYLDGRIILTNKG